MTEGPLINDIASIILGGSGGVGCLFVSLKRRFSLARCLSYVANYLSIAQK